MEMTATEKLLLVKQLATECHISSIEAFKLLTEVKWDYEEASKLAWARAIENLRGAPGTMDRNRY